MNERVFPDLLDHRMKENTLLRFLHTIHCEGARILPCFSGIIYKYHLRYDR